MHAILEPGYQHAPATHLQQWQSPNYATFSVYLRLSPCVALSQPVSAGRRNGKLPSMGCIAPRVTLVCVHLSYAAGNGQI